MWLTAQKLQGGLKAEIVAGCLSVLLAFSLSVTSQAHLGKQMAI